MTITRLDIEEADDTAPAHRKRGQDRRAPGNGGRDVSEWLRWGILLALAGLVSFFTTKNEIGRIDQRESSHFEEVLRGLTDLKDAVREIRNTQTSGKTGGGGRP